MAAKEALLTELKYCSELIQMKETGITGLDIRIKRSIGYITMLKNRIRRETKWQSMLNKTKG
jgi:hypothetical protein